MKERAILIIGKSIFFLVFALLSSNSLAQAQCVDTGEGCTLTNLELSQISCAAGNDGIQYELEFGYNHSFHVSGGCDYRNQAVIIEAAYDTSDSLGITTYNNFDTQLDCLLPHVCSSESRNYTSSNVVPINTVDIEVEVVAQIHYETKRAVIGGSWDGDCEMITTTCTIPAAPPGSCVDEGDSCGFGDTCCGTNRCAGQVYSSVGICTHDPQYYSPADVPVYTGPIIDYQSLINAIYAVMIPVAILLFALPLIIINGYKIMTSQGNPQRIQEGKEGLTSAIIGLIFVLLAMSILRIILNLFIGADSG